MDMKSTLPITPAPFLLNGCPPDVSRPAGSESGLPPLKEYFTDEDGDQVITYEVTPDGQVKEHDSSMENSSDGVMGEFGKLGQFLSNNRAVRGAKQFLVPNNMPGSVSADYTSTRTWTFLQSIAWNAANYAAGAAIAIALGVNPIWGGAAMATFNMIKDKLSQFIGFASTLAVPMIDRNPRPWIMAGEAIDHAGILVESATALAAGVPGALLPIGLAGCVLRTVSGSVKGPSMANIEPRQARAGNLGEVQKKNSNQNVISNLIGSMAGLYAIKSLMSMGFGALSPVIVAAAGAAIAIGSVVGLVKNLDLHPVNEKALRRVIEGLEKDQKVAGPDPSLWRSLKSIREPDSIVMGDKKLQPRPENLAHIKDLKNLYAGRNYMLDVADGKTSIFMQKGCNAEDCLTATVQAIYADYMATGEEYGKIVAKEGQDKADHWLLKSSLEKTPVDLKPLLGEMQKAGWSTDLLRPHDEGKRSTWSGIPQDEVLQYELAFEEPSRSIAS